MMFEWGLQKKSNKSQQKANCNSTALNPTGNLLQHTSDLSVLHDCASNAIDFADTGYSPNWQFLLS